MPTGQPLGKVWDAAAQAADGTRMAPHQRESGLQLSQLAGW